MPRTTIRRRVARTTAVLVAAAAWLQLPALAEGAQVPSPAGERILAGENWYTQWTKTTADLGAPVYATKPRLSWRTDQDVLWRGAGTRAPEVIFKEGLQPRGAKDPEEKRQYNWVGQVHNSETGTVYSGTSRSRQVAVDFAGAKGWVYEIHAPFGVDQTKSGTYQTMFGTYHGEQEITFPGGVKPRFIKQGCKVDTGVCQDNPGFDPSGVSTMEDVAAVTIDWSKVWPTEDVSDLPWQSDGVTAYAVGTGTLNPYEGEDAFREGLKPKATTDPWLGLFKKYVIDKPLPDWETAAAGAAVPGFTSQADAAALASMGKNGGWVYTLGAAHGFRTDLLDRLSYNPVPPNPVEFGYVGGVRGGLLLKACYFKHGETVADHCVDNPHPSAAADADDTARDTRPVPVG
ncbi:hypothetical protein ABTX81_01075 [Kitasatospora sp. NPDC097605]|uniref:scabin-related ADP-ribosyltransferase n=1 Tax=Kitasatospora sp. NPDC097605 TaxID=3157226 RepID=UPI0033203CE2